jgi:NAD dependent epimerase/dehydratase family enzyme
VNGVAPEAVTNADFTATLARVLRRPALLPVPAAAARLAFGEMADALLLASARVLPERLLKSGFAFRFPDLEGALVHVLGRPAP